MIFIDLGSFYGDIIYGYSDKDDSQNLEIKKSEDLLLSNDLLGKHALNLCRNGEKWYVSDSYSWLKKKFPEGKIIKCDPGYQYSVNSNLKRIARNRYEFSNPKRDINNIEESAKLVATKLGDAVAFGIKRCRMRNMIPVLLLSGGIDSSVIFNILKKKDYLDETKVLTFGIEGSSDISFVKKNFEKRDVEIIQLKKEEIENGVESFLERFPVYKSFVDTCLGVPLMMVSDELKNYRTCLILGTGAEELFLGYKYHEKYYRDPNELSKIQVKELLNLWSKDLSRNWDILSNNNCEYYLPFLNESFVKEALRIEPSLNASKLRKEVLRMAGISLGLNKTICSRPKKALQYSSGLARIIEKIKK